MFKLNTSFMVDKKTSVCCFLNTQIFVAATWQNNIKVLKHIKINYNHTN